MWEIWPPLFFLCPLFAYMLAVLNRKAGQILLHEGKCEKAKHGSDAEDESFLTGDNW